MVRFILAAFVAVLSMVALMAYPIHVRVFGFFVEHGLLGACAISACAGFAIFAAVKK